MQETTKKTIKCAYLIKNVIVTKSYEFDNILKTLGLTYCRESRI